MPTEITKQNAALALVDGRGLDGFGGPVRAATLLGAAREKAQNQVLGDGPRWHAAIAGLEQRGFELSQARKHDGAEQGLNQSGLASSRAQPRQSELQPCQLNLAAPRLGAALEGTSLEETALEETAELARVKALLLDLCPWRKGPFSVVGVHLDAEWRCDQKWARVMSSVSVANKTVLDVGCGNGYYLLRALGAGATAALGIDPTWLYVAQFAALRRLVNPIAVSSAQLPAWVLPLALEDLPAPHEPMADVVFSMGVLYHRKSPIEHLEALRHLVTPGGTLVLETLVVDGDDCTVLVPDDRYAAMRNVWMIPSVRAVCGWLRRCGYRDVEVADVTVTSVAEQRATEFMQSASLAQFLHATDSRLTIEGHPAPTRAIVVARRA